MCMCMHILVAKQYTVLNLILHMEKIISILKNTHFSGKGRQSLHILLYVMRISKMLIYVKLDHALYSINYSYQ